MRINKYSTSLEEHDRFAHINLSQIIYRKYKLQIRKKTNLYIVTVVNNGLWKLFGMYIIGWSVIFVFAAHEQLL